MSHKLRFARFYASQGLHVFPCHTITDGACSCGKEDCHSPGKHPMTANGLKDATIDIETIDNWWKQWPNANIGGVMGEKSGVIAIDFDDMDWFKHQSDIDLDLPETPIQVTGKGLHYIYKYPGFHIPTTTKAGGFPIDSRADGGYIMLAPSDHISGKKYSWKIGIPDAEIAECPKWWIDLLGEKKKARTIENIGDKIGEGGRNDTLFTYAYDLFIKEKFMYDDVEAFMYGLNAKKCIPPLDDEEVRSIVKSAFNRKMNAEEEERELLSHVDMESVLRNLKIKSELGLLDSTTATKEIIKPDFMPKRGLIREIAEYILAQSEKPLPTLAVAAATCFIGAMAGRKYSTTTGLGTNVVMVGVAGSASGKGKAKSIIEKIATECNENVNRRMGTSDFASGPGVISMLVDHPSRLCIIDEFGIFLNAVTGSMADQVKKEIARVIMVLYSSYDSVYRGTARADTKTNPAKIIHNPCLCIYGMSTPDILYKAFSSNHSEDGFMARLMIVDDGEKSPKINRDAKNLPVPQSFIDRINRIAERNNIGDIESSSTKPNIAIVQETKNVTNNRMDIADLMNEQEDNSKQSIFGRVVENAMKLALIHAISVDQENPIINDESFGWGLGIATYCAERLIEINEKHVSDTKAEAESKKYFEYIDGYKDGVSKRILSRNGPARKHKTSERDEYINMLREAGKIYVEGGKYYSAKNYKIYLQSKDE